MNEEISRIDINNVNYKLKDEDTRALGEMGKQSLIKIGYYECSSEASSASKTIAAPNYVLGNGGSMKVKMTNANSANNATLNINSTGAKALYYSGERASANNSWEAGETIEVYYDGINYYANNVAGGSGGDGVFDVTAKTGDVYATLGDALTAANSVIPANKKKGGMSIKFVQGTVQSSDNKYVQARCMAQNFTTDVTQWQGVDDEPTVGSENLVKSGGVAGYVRVSQNTETGHTDITIGDTTTPVASIKEVGIKEPVILTPTIISGVCPWDTRILSLEEYISWYIPVTRGESYTLDLEVENSDFFRYGFTTQVPAADVAITGYNAVVAGKRIVTPESDGYFVIGAQVSNNPSVVFSSVQYLPINKIIVGSVVDMSTIRKADGAFNTSGDISWTGSTFFHTEPTKVTKGTIIRFNGINSTMSMSLLSEVNENGDWIASILNGKDVPFTGNIIISDDCFVSISGYGDQATMADVAVIDYQGIADSIESFESKFDEIDDVVVKDSENIADGSIFTKVGLWKYNMTFDTDSDFRTSTKIKVNSYTTYYIRDGINYIVITEFDRNGEILKVTAKTNPSSASVETSPITEYIEISVNSYNVGAVCVGLLSGMVYTRGFAPVITRKTSELTAKPAKTYDVLNTWRGKTFLAIGDSVTYRDQYQKIIDFYLGTSHTTKAKSGMSIGGYCFEYSGDVAISLISPTDLQAADLILITSYINNAVSLGAGAELGTMSDSFLEISQEAAEASESYNAYKSTITAQNFTQAARSTIEYVLNNCGKTPVIIVGNLQFAGSDNYGVDNFNWVNNKGYNRRQFAQRFKEIASYYSLPYVNLEDEGGVNPFNASHYYNDNIHPNFAYYTGGDNWNDCGMRKMAMPIIQKILMI